MSEAAVLAERPKVEIPGTPLRDPACWLGRDLQHKDDWQYRLTPADIADLDAAIESVTAEGRALIDVEKGDFPLPHLGSTLAKLRREVMEGRGFTLIRGVPVQRLGRDKAALAYWGMGRHLGYPVSQNAKGQLLGHVVDLGEVTAPKADSTGQVGNFTNTNVRGYNSRERFYFHIDHADIVGLLCLHQARSGGESLIASSIAIHNEIQKTRPDLLRVLYEPFWVSRKGEIPAGSRPYFKVPVFTLHQGRLFTCLNPGPIRHAQNFPEVPRLTDAQVEALDLIDSLASEPRFYLSMVLDPGDIQFINNYTTLHTRTAYQDFPELDRRRHLMRLWLVTPDLPPLTEWHHDWYGAGRRGGIYVPGVREVASLEP